MVVLIIFGVFFFAILVIILIGKFGGNKEKDSLESSNQEREYTPQELREQQERREIYELKRSNFQQNALRHFRFLVEEFGYSEPSYKKYQQENGTVTTDEFRYENAKVDRLIEVSNSYHPNDYGFDVCFYRPSITTQYSEEKNKNHIVYNVDYEDQDLEQTYIEEAAKVIKEKCKPQIKGEAWFNE